MSRKFRLALCIIFCCSCNQHDSLDPKIELLTRQRDSLQSSIKYPKIKEDFLPVTEKNIMVYSLTGTRTINASFEDTHQLRTLKQQLSSSFFQEKEVLQHKYNADSTTFKRAEEELWSPSGRFYRIMLEDRGINYSKKIGNNTK